MKRSVQRRPSRGKGQKAKSSASWARVPRATRSAPAGGGTNQGGRNGRRASPAFGGQLETWPVCVATAFSSSNEIGPRGCAGQPTQAENATLTTQCLRERRRAALQSSDKPQRCPAHQVGDAARLVAPLSRTLIVLVPQGQSLAFASHETCKFPGQASVPRL